MKHSSFLLMLPLALSLSISSCVGPGFGGGGGYGNGYSNGYGGFNTYSTLPGNFSGSAYNHNGRYYSGGNYQTGNYSYQGRPYTSRYSHNGQYYYGGTHQNYSPQHNRGYNSNLRVNTPVMQTHSNSQFMQRRH
ncbi:MAG: hypothetical protein ACYC67_18225 [Prosthecobacter sp.]